MFVVENIDQDKYTTNCVSVKIVKNLYISEFFFTTSNQCIYTCRSCLQNISFVNLKPHPAELIN